MTVDSERLGRGAGQIAQEVVGHLQALPGAKVAVQIEISAEIPHGAPENAVRTVSDEPACLEGAHALRQAPPLSTRSVAPSARTRRLQGGQYCGVSDEEYPESTYPFQVLHVDDEQGG